MKWRTRINLWIIKLGYWFFLLKVEKYNYFEFIWIFSPSLIKKNTTGAQQLLRRVFRCLSEKTAKCNLRRIISFAIIPNLRSLSLDINDLSDNTCNSCKDLHLFVCEETFQNVERSNSLLLNDQNIIKIKELWSLIRAGKNLMWWTSWWWIEGDPDPTLHGWCISSKASRSERKQSSKLPMILTEGSINSAL